MKIHIGLISMSAAAIKKPRAFSRDFGGEKGFRIVYDPEEGYIAFDKRLGMDELRVKGVKLHVQSKDLKSVLRAVKNNRVLIAKALKEKPSLVRDGELRKHAQFVVKTLDKAIEFLKQRL